MLRIVLPALSIVLLFMIPGCPSTPEATNTSIALTGTVIEMRTRATDAAKHAKRKYAANPASLGDIRRAYTDAKATTDGLISQTIGWLTANSAPEPGEVQSALDRLEHKFTLLDDLVYPKSNEDEREVGAQEVLAPLAIAFGNWIFDLVEQSTERQRAIAETLSKQAAEAEWPDWDDIK